MMIRRWAERRTQRAWWTSEALKLGFTPRQARRIGRRLTHRENTHGPDDTTRILHLAAEIHCPRQETRR